MPHHDLDRIKTYNRRTAMLAGGQFLLLSALVGRLYYLQVLQSDRYVMLADENRINIKLLQPPRGRILDRKGEALAINPDHLVFGNGLSIAGPGQTGTDSK